MKIEIDLAPMSDAALVAFGTAFAEHAETAPDAEARKYACFHFACVLVELQSRDHHPSIVEELTAIQPSVVAPSTAKASWR